LRQQQSVARFAGAVMERNMKNTVLSMMVLVGALAATEALAQGSVNQNGREFRSARESGMPSRSGREAPRRSPRDAYAARGFDGGWSVAISTRSGACDPQYRFGLQIINNQRANGQGRLSGAHGSGVWRGYGSAGTCAGTWVAQRH
jgi:hypothetical protein